MRRYRFDNKDVNERDTQTISSNDNVNTPRSPYPIEKGKSGRNKYYAIALIVLFVLGFGLSRYYRDSANNQESILQPVQKEISTDGSSQTSTHEDEYMTTSRQQEESNESHAAKDNSTDKIESPTSQPDITPAASTSEILERTTHANVVEQARQAGVSTEGATSEILDRITHANVVEQARQAGVSTKGSTSEILDRITHANVVEQARQAGVSTEGSTSEILDRITHANVVEQARQAGVSTKGSTSEILDRLTRKQLERLGQ